MAQEVAATPLTDLCAICHINPIKYTCPRDGIHTCSLPCVKRHKQWAQCSGVRDPAEYRKRSELATASSIDKDFNFITSVERSLFRADGLIADRGINLVPARLRPNDARPKFELEAETRGIKIIKAPKGLSRNKQNRTQWGGQPKCIVWTVEWLCDDGSRMITAAPETKTIGDLFGAASASLRRHSKKRKRPLQAEDGNSANATGATDKAHTGQNAEEALPVDRGIGTGTASNKEFQPESLPTLRQHQYFYLHRPNTESKYKCLIPLIPTEPLQVALHNKTLVEFPTIYVRNESPDQLPPPFITENEYVKRHGVDIPINVSTAAPSTTESGDLEEGELEQGDVIPNIVEEKVLEVLAKDLGG